MSSALLFAVASWLIIEHWVYPHFLASFREMAGQDIVLTAQPDLRAIVRLCLPSLTIAAAQLAGALVLAHPRLGEAKLARRGAIIALALIAGWIAAAIAFIPPDLGSPYRVFRAGARVAVAELARGLAARCASRARISAQPLAAR